MALENQALSINMKDYKMKMKIQVIAATALALSMFSGASFAQDSDNVFMDKTMMMPFFTDDSMNTMRSDEELRAAFTALSPEAQAKLIKDCNDPLQYRNLYHYGLCEKIQ